jgi:hypothetical protein
MARIAVFAAFAFALLYLAAIALFIIGNYGLFGQPRDPLSAVFLMPLGLPWTLLADVVQPLPGRIVALFAPLVNLAILVALALLMRSHTLPPQAGP